MTARGQTTRAKLLHATSTVVREVGYSGTTVRAVAQAAGVAEGTIYRHFPDKASLLLAVVSEQSAPVVEWMTTLPARAGVGEVADTLTDCLTRLAGLRESVLPLELAMLTDPELAAARDRRGPPPGTPDPPRLLGAYLAAEQARGRLRPDVDPQEAAVLLLVTLFGLAASPPTPAAGIPVLTVRRTVDLLLTGLAPGS
ncbi:TetR/AcrR family transcriptional regulator [Kineococcus rubinsiae]|uniref:TetR/AcrR family transcriptional regulator n=1 Tax=Kineococcus rubinsiae TaxID=2609562 RepID=UPI001430D7B6|nr:TetR/AcrR family transcriptional regulator [Kineococcus rubinsiae]NIZ91940.1 TetR/AcrR family transcriptional regulator [Kineococcus rubinsiae]